MDEWSTNTLDAETAKKLFQGGFYVASVKHQKPTTTILRCPFYIAAMEVPKFGETDDPAIQRRLAIFETKSLPTPIARANEWLRKNCMQVFHYVSEELKDEPLFSDDEDDDFQDDDEHFGEGAVFNDYDRSEASLISTDDIASLEFTQDETSTENAPLYDPHQSITKEDEESLLKTAVELEPHRHEIEHRLQITNGETSSEEYLKSVMLMIASNMRVLRLSRSEELRLELLARQQNQEPNAALDAWLLLHGKRRKEFQVQLLIQRYPGMKHYLKEQDDVHIGDDDDGRSDDDAQEDEQTDDDDDDDDDEQDDAHVGDDDDDCDGSSDGDAQEDEQTDDDDNDDDLTSCSNDEQEMDAFKLIQEDVNM